MNLAPLPFSVPSSAADSQGGVSGLDSTMVYAPSHLDPDPESMRNHPGQLSGLGIYHCAMESLPSQPRLSSRPQPMHHLSMNEWQGSAMPDHSLPNTFLSAGGIPGEVAYQTYGARSISSNTTLDFAHYPSHNMDLSQCYGHETGFCSDRGTFYSQSGSSWPVTPSSRATTPSVTPVRVKEELDGAWEPPFFRDPRDECHAQTMSTIPQVVVDNSSSPQISRGQLNGKFFGGSEVDWSTRRGRSSSVDHSSIELSPKSEKDNEGVDLGRDVASMSGLQCNVCGYLFTRRSNCREHMKKHDPSQRKGYECETCAKTFGRRTDLKRHVESIHHGTRRFGCDQCGRRFTRHDTLTRHCADGCKRKQRKHDRVESPVHQEPSEQYPSPSPSFESPLYVSRFGPLEQPLTTRISSQSGPVKSPLGRPHSPAKRK
ncbi:transcriptional regulator family: C2H2 zinc finger [Paecilomyces variotii]|nr:transcriptional regulator family: C2H2 zinc finger [Paecilomyces variotii]